MKNLRKYKKATSYLLLAFCFSNNINYSYANEIYEVNSRAQIEKSISSPKLTLEQYIQLQKYAYNYITNNRHNIEVEKNESGFFRIRIKTPSFIDKKLGIDKLRLNFWPMDESNKIQLESIHDHPSYFESYILYGGYVHSIYKMYKNDNTKDTQKLTLYRINKNKDGSKSFDNLGATYLKKDRDEKVKEGKIVVMPTNIIHRVLRSVPGSLSLNVVYKDKQNKNYYNTMLTKNATEADVKTSRTMIIGKQKDNLINQIEKRLFNSLFQNNQFD